MGHEDSSLRMSLFWYLIINLWLTINMRALTELEERIYYGIDETIDDKNGFYPLEFLNSINVSGLFPHCLQVKVGCPIILLRNIDPANRLCNGNLLICKSFQ
uniref:DNA helicase Pif1-like 2B domain-containing protein n=1 Tax=Lactuca sativa TaxID=4236 RepID=A0A9R1XHK5_LACSA|nr:hypothetical protein LSAT_V11C400179690 [Lactuca sativa]